MSANMHTSPRARPWYCSDTLVESYKQIESSTGKLRMLQALKVIRAIILNFLVLGGGIFFVSRGGDPTLLGVGTIITLALLNGIEVSEWVAAKQALQELDQMNNDDED